MIPRDKYGDVDVRRVTARRAAILFWLLDNREVWGMLTEPELGYMMRGTRPVPRQLSEKGRKVVEKALKAHGFYSQTNQAVEARNRVREAETIAKLDLRERTYLRRLAAGYKPPHL